MTLTERVAQFASHLRAEQLPAPILRKIRLHLIDALGCGWAGSATPLGEQARQLAQVLGGQGRCQVLGSSQCFAPAAAAFANAFIINALDHDDGVEIEGKGLGHPGASLVAAALAAIDQHPEPIAESDLLAALAAGFEINNRLIHAQQPSADSFAKAYGIAQHQAIGAAIVYARACGFDEHTLHNAIGFAATLTCVPSLHKYNWQQRPIAALKDAVAPAAQGGVQAAIMARQGLAGSRDVLDGEQGYWRMMGSDRFDSSALLEGLGEQWYIRFGSFKRYPACRWLATSLECTQTLLAQSGWDVADIASIEVQTFARLAEDFMIARPATATDAQFSLPYTVAATALGIPFSRWYSERTLNDAALLALAARVQVRIDPAFEARMRGPERKTGARVIIANRAGECLQMALDSPLGSAARPMQEAEVLDKAVANLQGLVAQPRERVMGWLSGDGQQGQMRHWLRAD